MLPSTPLRKTQNVSAVSHFFHTLVDNSSFSVDKLLDLWTNPLFLC